MVPLHLSIRLFIPRSATLLGCLVCVIVIPNVFIPYIQTLHIDCSHIEDVHLLFYAHLINILAFFRGVELRHFFHPKCLEVSALCNL